jgi:hypothetical protein
MSHANEDRADEIETQLIEQEHRLPHILYRFFYRKSLYPNKKSQQTATGKAVIWGIVFSPATIAVGGGIAALITAWLMYQQTSIMRQTADPTNRVQVKVDQIALVKNDGLQLTVAFSNAGNFPVYLEDLHCVLLYRMRHANVDGTLNEASQQSMYYKSTLLPIDNRVVAPKSFDVVRYQMPNSADLFPETAIGFQPSEKWKSLYLPAEGRGRIKTIPKTIADNYLVYMIVRVPVRTSDDKILKTFAVSRLLITGVGSVMNEKGEIQEQIQAASGEIWPPSWKEAIEGPTDLSELSVFNRTMYDKATQPTVPWGGVIGPIPIEDLVEQIVPE